MVVVIVKEGGLVLYPLILWMSSLYAILLKLLYSGSHEGRFFKHDNLCFLLSQPFVLCCVGQYLC